MRRDHRAARAVLGTIGVVMAAGAPACGDTSPASPTGTTTTSPTTATTPYTPRVNALAPARGADAGGTTVTITGEHFSPSPTVKIGGAAATSLICVSDTQPGATTPA